jgi:hypothetical protein
MLNSLFTDNEWEKGHEQKAQFLEKGKEHNTQ